ncbi:MAG: hypothetical protein AAGB34_11615 [Planctomycetota bacterium]
MREHVISSAITVSIVAFSAGTANAFGFSDVDVWVGSGSKQAALVVDWFDSGDPVAFGYRYDGSQTAEDMLFAIARANVGLFVRAEVFSFGTAVNGLGYDRDSDGFAIDSGLDFGDGVSFDSNLTFAVATDADDSYIEGFQNGAFWNFGVSDGTTDWAGSGVGISGSSLDSFAFNSLAFGSFPTFSRVDIPAPGAATLVAISGIAALRRRR